MTTRQQNQEYLVATNTEAMDPRKSWGVADDSHPDQPGPMLCIIGWRTEYGGPFTWCRTPATTRWDVQRLATCTGCAIRLDGLYR